MQIKRGEDLRELGAGNHFDLELDVTSVVSLFTGSSDVSFRSLARPLLFFNVTSECRRLVTRVV